MVDMVKHACRQLAKNGYKNGQWPEVILPGSFYLITPGPWNLGTSSLTGIVYPDCIIENPT